jgi:hypothetical protein
VSGRLPGLVFFANNCVAIIPQPNALTLGFAATTALALGFAAATALALGFAATTALALGFPLLL